MSADLVLINGKVITLDSRSSIHQAVATKGQRVVAVGTNEEVRALAGKDTRILNLRGGTVLPGINDSHIHAALYGGTRPPLALDLRLPKGKSIEEIVKLVGEEVRKAKHGEWIKGIGWQGSQLRECLNDKIRLPTRWDLDPVSPNNPVYLIDFSVHGLWVNTKALELAGITKDTMLVSGGRIEKDPATGEPTGMLWEFPAQGLVMRAVPPWSRAQKREAILSAMRELNSLGITSITEGALGPGGTGYAGGLIDSECISIYNDLYNEGKLTVRVNIMFLFGDRGACSYRDFQELMPRMGIHSGFGNEWLRIAGVKIFADGVPMTARTAWMSQEYPGGGKGSLTFPGDTEEARCDEMMKIIAYAHHHGFQVGIHAVGDRATEESINGLVKAIQAEPKRLRHYIIHGAFVSESYIKLMAAYEIGFNKQPALGAGSSPSAGPVAQTGTGAQNLRSLIDAGIRIASGSDAPVTYPNWKLGVEMAVTRQGLTREEAIRIYTTGGAWQDHMENVKGSIEAGKLADLCILDQDILTLDAPRIRDITTVATISGGKIVYGTGNLDQRARRKERSALGSREKQFKSRAGETTPEGLNTNSRSARTRTF